jgi:hypothetical protein
MIAAEQRNLIVPVENGPAHTQGKSQLFIGKK